MKNPSVQRIREFNRFYTRVIGLLQQHVLNSPFSLAEARILYELYHGSQIAASDILATLQIDKGQLSRMLVTFKRKGLLARKRSETDTRVVYLYLTQKGALEFEKINLTSEDQIQTLLKKLSAAEQSNLLFHMKKIQEILDKSMA